jgi:hypothetical protein
MNEENIKQEVQPQNREDSPFFKAAMKMHKSAKELQNMSPEKHGLSDDEHKTKVDRMFGRYNQLLSNYYGSVGHSYMRDLHKKRAKELMGSEFQEQYQTEADFSHKQKMMDYALKASEKNVSDAKDFATGKLEKNDKIQRRLNFIKKALDRVNK